MTTEQIIALIRTVEKKYGESAEGYKKVGLWKEEGAMRDRQSMCNELLLVLTKGQTTTLTSPIKTSK